jgi:hypothetical protein
LLSRTLAEVFFLKRASLLFLEEVAVGFASHQQKRLLHLKVEGSVKGYRQHVEGILDQTDTDCSTSSFEYGSHEPAPYPVNLDGRVNGNRPETTDGIAFVKEIGADDLTIALSDDAIEGWVMEKLARWMAVSNVGK